MPAESIATSVTSASPIISAEAVDAVRCGLRRALSRARLPIGPAILVAGQPSHVARRGTIRADSRATPMKTMIAPAPIKPRVAPVPLTTNRPRATATNPSVTVAAELTLRYRDIRPSGSAAPSRTAAMGSTRVARSAGRRLASTVTITPTRIETITVRTCTTVPLLGSVRPAALNSAKRPWANPSPASMPTTEATMPTARDSARIERSTWRRDAPSVRRVANSRVRWAIVIESELAITKLPTNRETPANTRRNVLRKDRKPLVAAASLVACAAPVRTCVSWGSTGRI